MSSKYKNEYFLEFSLVKLKHINFHICLFFLNPGILGVIGKWHVPKIEDLQAS